MRDYIDKYPWLRLRNLYSGEICKNLDAMDDMPEGWKVAFGDLMLEELDEAIKEEGLEGAFVVEQVKEKFGGLRFYTSPVNEKIDRIIDDYSYLSHNICIECGRPDVPTLNLSWISPFCEDCYNKFKDRWRESRSYEEAAGDNPVQMASKREILRSAGEGKIIRITYDTSERAAKIREAYRKRTEGDEDGEKE